LRSPPGPDPALLLEQEDAAMISAGLSTRQDSGHLILTLRGEPDVIDAASVTAGLAAASVRSPWIIIMETSSWLAGE